uniref:Uncharacterized protein n=1 Tax=Caenorhabditis japonica TaxID=281687 RepID=A0A8R1IKC0_CAEJA
MSGWMSGWMDEGWMNVDAVVVVANIGNETRRNETKRGNDLGSSLSLSLSFALFPLLGSSFTLLMKHTHTQAQHSSVSAPASPDGLKLNLSKPSASGL